MNIKTYVTLSVNINIPLEKDEHFSFKGKEYIFEKCYSEETHDGKLEIIIEAAECATNDCADFISEIIEPCSKVNIDLKRVKFYLNFARNEEGYITKV